MMSVPFEHEQVQSEVNREDHRHVQDLGTQLVISTSPDASRFQKGYLGAEGESAAIEGELQIKGAHSDKWESVTVALRCFETVDQTEVELGSMNLLLFSRAGQSSSNPSATSVSLPSSIPFSFPLQSDIPQCIHTSRSSLTHNLTATLHPLDHSNAPLTQSIRVHTRRYTSHHLAMQTSPHTIRTDMPTRIEVQVPRTTFRIDEPIPVYVTIPPPDRSVVLDQGLSLRNIRVDFLRDIALSTPETPSSSSFPPPPSDSSESDEDEDDESDSGSSIEFEEPPSAAFTGLINRGASTSFPSSSLYTPLQSSGSSNSHSNIIETTLARSGAACRFHSSKTVRLRFVLHPSTDFQTENSQGVSGSAGSTEGSTECASISQSTVMHTVSFQLRVHATFLHARSHTEQVSTLSIPLTIIPPPAPTPEVDPSTDAAYRKKYDRPPTKTIRREDEDADDLPGFVESSSSVHHSTAPPPFEDAPPPFFSSNGDPSTSRPPPFSSSGDPSTSRPPPFSSNGETSTSRLPTFLESESEIWAPSDDHPAFPSAPPTDAFEGEGVIFGFSPSQQYDGHSDEILRPSTPPPTMEMARQDADLTELADLISRPQQALEALNMSQQEHSSSNHSEFLPPPPPRMDDPSDPPPSIDTEFQPHALDDDPPPSIHEQEFSGVPPSGLSVPPMQTRTSSTSSQDPQVMSRSDSVDAETVAGNQAPPSYLISTGMRGQNEPEHVTRPPPYVELVPSSFH